MRTSPTWTTLLTERLGSRRDLRAVISHLAETLAAVPTQPHLLHVDSDLCASGHVHLAIVVWAVTDDDLVVLETTEEHYDHEDQAVETTFQVNLTRYPVDTVEGARLSSEVHPDGSLLSKALTVPVRARESLLGSAVPAFCEDPDCDADHGYDVDVRSAPPTFVTADPTVDLHGFQQAVLERRRARGGGFSPA